MKENEKLALFYEECIKKGYSDMTDSRQALKAKVIAADRKLRYGNSIEQFFQKAKAAYEEREAKRKEEEQRAAAEERRLAVQGKELVKLHRGYSALSVFKRPDGSIYYTTDKDPETKIEGKPEVRVESSSVTMFTYHPSETNITMASKGGFTSGQVWQTEPTVTPHNVKNGKAYLEVSVNGESWTIDLITLSPFVLESFKRYSSSNDNIKQGLSAGKIKCRNAIDSMYGMSIKEALNRNDMYSVNSRMSMAVDESRLPTGEIKEIAKLLYQILDGPWPENDEQAYQRGARLIRSAKSAEILEGIDLLQGIGENHPRKSSAEKLIEEHKRRYDEVLQSEKEAAVLKKEDDRRKRKKTLITALKAACICAVVAVVVTQLIVPMVKHKKAVDFIAAGDYDAGYTILKELGKTEEIVQNKYDRAMACIEKGEYEAAYRLLTEIGKKGDFSKNNKHDWATVLLDEKKYDEAYKLFNEIGEQEIVAQSKRERAEVLLEQKNYDEAYKLYDEIGEQETIAQSKRERANVLLGQKKYEEAYDLLNQIGDTEAIAASKYERGMELLASKRYRAVYDMLCNLSYKDSIEQAAYARKMILADAVVGDIIQFGEYHGSKDWIVLAREDDRILVISKQSLDSQPYDNGSSKNITWATCSLRKWLNDEFLNAAFSEAEKAMILTVTLSEDEGEEWRKYNTGPDTQDKVFLLSKSEYLREFYSGNIESTCTVTEYVQSIRGDLRCWWWLRSPCIGREAPTVNATVGSLANATAGTVRPAMWIDLSA